MGKNDEITVLHLISSLGRGGSERLLVDTVKNLNGASIKIVVVVMNNIIDENLKSELTSCCKNVYFLNRIQGKKSVKYLFNLNKIIKEHKINIIHTHNFGSKCWAILCKIKNPNLKLVHTLHDTRLKDFDSMTILHNLFINKSIAISNSVYNKAKKNCIKKVEVIYNGIDIKKFQNSSNIKNQKTNEIINVGRIVHQKKGQDILIRAIKECVKKGVEVNCSFVGQSDGYCTSSYNYLCELVKELKLEEHVTFLGNREDVEDLLHKSKIFVLASRFEGFGLVVLEAMAAGIPVIASNIEGPAEIIQDNINGLLFEYENYTELAKKIVLLCSNAELYNRLSNNSLEFVKKYDVSVMSQKYAKLYRNLIVSGKVV
jgi:glycosyltransferase involved in cell wall biosynthesis